MHENKFFPHIDSERNQAISLAIKVLDSFEVGNAFERAVKPVSPAVIGALQARRSSARLSHYCCSVMATNVKESAQLAVLSAHHKHRLSGNFSGDVLPWSRNLFRAADHLPGSAEHSFALEFRDALVGVPRPRNRGGTAERFLWIKSSDNFLK